jgi:hypothetical protein
MNAKEWRKRKTIHVVAVANNKKQLFLFLMIDTLLYYIDKLCVDIDFMIIVC